MADDRNPMAAIPILIITIILIGGYYVMTQAADILSFTMFVMAILGVMGFVYLLVSYSGEKESKLYGLKPLIDKIPAVKRPEGHVHFRTKMLWTLGILIFYFVMTNVMMYGLEQSIDIFSEFRAIMAGANGSLMHLGIGPIVTGSIIMQLFTGAKIIKLDLTNEEDKAVYQGTQKVVVLMMIAVESAPQVYGYLIPHTEFINSVGDSTARLIIVAQLFVGSYLVFLMDEVVSKWGIGSGISMFIAAGVSEAIFTGTINWMPTSASEQVYAGSPSGTIPKTVYLLQKMSIGQVAGGGWESIFIQEPNPIIALIGTIVIFLVVAYVESSRVELPLAHGRVRGARGRYPIRLIYASNIPVILMAALLANVNMFSLLLWNHPSLMRIPLIGHQWWIGAFNPGETQPHMGGAWYLSRPAGVQAWLLPLMNWERYSGFVTGHNYYQVTAHVFVYLGVMIVGSILFAKFWIETTNMGPEAVAKQIQSSGMQIPGFRRDPRVLRKVLRK
jgi:preprotein translocase subunit SecY